MNKKVLILYYSQSGQLGEIADYFAAPFLDEGVEIEKIRISPEEDFPFPWTSKNFFDAMPESVLGKPLKLNIFDLKHKSYDLIVIAYQPWFLLPSIPATSLYYHPGIKELLQNTPVITLIGARNMWLNAQEKIKKFLSEAGAKHIGNIVRIDNNGNLASAVSILYWMLTGKRDRYLGIFPRPGVSEQDVEKTEKYGEIVKDALMQDDWHELQHKLIKAGAVKVKPNLMFIEGRAGRLFSIWANVIAKKKSRSFWLVLFKYYLLIALFIVAPLVLTVYYIFFRPFLLKSEKRKMEYYMGVQGIKERDELSLQD